jgi:hypothetical protein
MNMTGQRKAWKSRRLSTLPSALWKTPVPPASPHIPTTPTKTCVVFEVQEEDLLNVRHFAIDKDYLHILVDEDLLRA